MSSVLTVSQMAQALGLSRDRFYDHVRTGTFPPPAYRLDNRRPVYPPELQALCHAIRDSGNGFGGGLALFNRPRAGARPVARPKRPATGPKGPERAQPTLLRELGRRLAYFGVQAVSDAELLAALGACRLDPFRAVNDLAAMSALLRHFADRRV